MTISSLITLTLKPLLTESTFPITTIRESSSPATQTAKFFWLFLGNHFLGVFPETSNLSEPRNRNPNFNSKGNKEWCLRQRICKEVTIRFQIGVLCR